MTNQIAIVALASFTIGIFFGGYIMRWWCSVLFKKATEEMARQYNICISRYDKNELAKRPF